MKGIRLESKEVLDFIGLKLQGSTLSTYNHYLIHQQRNFGALTPCSGTLMPAVLLLPLGAPVLSGR